MRAGEENQCGLAAERFPLCRGLDIYWWVRGSPAAPLAEKFILSFSVFTLIVLILSLACLLSPVRLLFL